MPRTDPKVKRLIVFYARAYNVDPNAALAVAAGEGGIRYGAVGDQGSSFGPFQLHVGGALPAGKGPEFANSPAGIEYAIRKMAEAGASGLRGRAAIEKIVGGFERPADPAGSIRRALTRYGIADLAGGAAPAGAAAAGGLLADPRLQAVYASGNALVGVPTPDLSMVAAAPQNASQAPSGASSSIDDMLARFGLADAVTSGDRSPGRNRAVGGSPTSFHLQPGRARDINPQAAASGRLVSYAYQNPQQFAEFFGPFDWYVKNGQIRRGRFPGHGDHIHAVLT